jgi:hypothetical protein
LITVHDIDFQPSALAPLRVVRQVKAVLPEAVAAVEQYMGAVVPPLTVVVAGRTGLATAGLMASGTRGASRGAMVAQWRNMRSTAGQVLGYTSATRTDRVLVAVNGRALKSWPREEVRVVIVHELVHAVQITRPGRRQERQAEADHALGIVEAPDGLIDGRNAIRAIEEAEAHIVEHALDPNAEPQAPFDTDAVLLRLNLAALNWHAAADAAHRRAGAAS